MRAIKINKPTHKFFLESGTPAIAIGQKRGDALYINLFENGELILKTWAVGTAADHLTGYGHGITTDNAEFLERMRSAWRFMFGTATPLPAFVERVK